MIAAQDHLAFYESLLKGPLHHWFPIVRDFVGPFISTVTNWQMSL